MDLIVACDRAGGIGRAGDLLCSIPADMKYFREKTAGKTVVMGQRTLLSFPGGKPLKGRINVVLSDDPEFNPEGTVTVHSVEDMKREIARYPEDEVMLIGGASMYNAFYPLCRRAYITWIEEVFEDADVFIPSFDRLEGWRLESISEPIETGGHIIRFAVYANERMVDS